MNTTQKFTSLVAAITLAALALTGCASTGADTAKTADTMAAQVTVSDAWVKEPTMPGMTGMFGVIENTGDSEVVLVGGSSDIAGMVEIHEVTAEGQMQKLENGLAIGAGQTTTLEVGGNHIMLMKLNTTLAVGDEVTVTLKFKDGSTLPVTGLVKSTAGGDESYNESTEMSNMGG
jgi:copper(I)-binding protein